MQGRLLWAQGGSLPTCCVDISSEDFPSLSAVLSHQQSPHGVASLNSSCQRDLETWRSVFLPAGSHCSLLKAKKSLKRLLRPLGHDEIQYQKLHGRWVPGSLNGRLLRSLNLN